MAYPTSELYKMAIKQPTRTSNISGTLKLTNGTIINIKNDDISQGSFYITNQCVSKSAFEFGSVYSSEASLTLNTEIDRYTLFDAVFTPFFNLLLSDGTYESIPLGVFKVNEANRNGKSVSLKCYDDMINLSKDLEESTIGTVYELLSFVSLRCDVSLAQTEEEINALPNTSKLYTVDITKVLQYRDLVAFLSIVTCTFALINREGKLELRRFSHTSSLTIDRNRRSVSSFSDFTSYHSKVKARFLIEGSYVSYQSSVGDDGLTLNLGDIPIVQGIDATNQEVIKSIMDELSKIIYVPCDFKFSGDPSIDLGDLITNYDKFNNEIKSLVTYYKWTYRNGEQIKSVGSNPRLALAQSKEQKESVINENSTESKTLRIFSYTNAKEFVVQGGDSSSITGNEEIVRISFAANEDSLCMFLCTVYFEAIGEGTIEFRTFIDGAYYPESLVGQSCKDGVYTVSFTNYILAKGGSQSRVSVLARTFSDEGTTVLKAKISEFSIKAMITGQGLASEIPWDGTIQCEDTINGHIILDNASITVINEMKSCVSTVTEMNNAHAPFSINLGGLVPFSNEGITVKPLAAEFILKEILGFYEFETSQSLKYRYDMNYVLTDNDEFKLKDTYYYVGEESNIDTGRLRTLEIHTSQFANVSSIEVEVI